ncbi:RecBCD enzyme subunit RecD [Streptomyces sp. enrichment culture]|uniref:AAA domain-containing protein n=1 Tax=Streptomyces sp. enrichment culture TaxID=1795815 RepID=UPI003F55EE55
MDVARRHAGHHDVITATSGLIGFLREVVHSSATHLRDDRGDRNRDHLWLAHLPTGVRRPTAREDGLLLAVEHAPQTMPPPLPASLDGWVAPEHQQDPENSDPPLANEGPDPGHGNELVPRAESTDVLRAYTSWLARWRLWAVKEREARALRDLYERVYRWHQRLAQQDDQTELVLAAGLLTWRDHLGRAVHRHLVTHRVVTTMERRTGRLTVRLAPESSLQMEDRDFLDGDDSWDSERATAVAEELTTHSPHPLDEAVLEQLTKWQERALTRPISFTTDWTPPAEPETGGRLTYAPALIMRPRDRNALLRCYEQIAASIATEAQAPLGLAQLALDLDDSERANWQERGTAAPPLLGDDPLFPLKTNAQQRDVIRRLERNTGVVVQGPPGTGKTHTIANLISALLAQGQRVLVTSARDQPLTVLRDKLPPAVRDLCVLLLSSTRQDGTNELERTVNALTDQMAATSPDQLRDRIAELTGQRDKVRARIAVLTDEVVALRESETRVHRGVALGYEGTLAVIVRRLQDEMDRYAWFGELPEGSETTPPLSGAQAQELLALLREENEPQPEGSVLPDPAALPSADEVAGAITDSRLSDEGLSPEAAALRDTLAGLAPSVTEELRAALHAARTALHQLGVPAAPALWEEGSWTSRALEDRLARRNARLWQLVSGAAADLEEVRARLDTLGLRLVELPDGLAPSTAALWERAGDALRRHLAGGGRLRTRFASRAQKDARELLDGCTVDGRPPSTAEDLDVVLTYLRAHLVTATVIGRWKQTRVPLPDGPIDVRLAILAERYERLEQIDIFGAARERIDKVLVQESAPVPLTTRVEWQDLADAMAALAGRRAADAALAKLAAWDQRLRIPLGDSAHPAPEALAVARALREGDTDRYAKELEVLTATHTRGLRARRCSVLLGTLKAAHPALASALAASYENTSWEPRLAELHQAWAWAAAARFVRRQRTPGRERRLEGELGEQEARLERLTGELAGAKGQLHCWERMTPRQRTNLQAYRVHVASQGKGKGRHTAVYKAAARESMDLALDAVPAWVTPISQVAEMMQAKRNAFDVVIVDEASQAGMDALFLLWLAPRVIVVGDDKQCSPPPSALGRTQPIHDRLIAHLPDMPLSRRQLFTPHASLYALLSTLFPDAVRLQEHFRCMPEIITWSSETYYNRQLVPLRQFGGDRLEPLLTHFVEGAVTEGRDSRIRNAKEAEAIVDCLARMVEDPAYADKTMGVIVLRGQGQIRLLDDLIKQRLPEARQRHEIRVGNAASFQGDERDIILLSMVVTDPPKIAGGHASEQQAYNVAASRARDQMRLFHSVPRERLKSTDLRLNLLSYMENPPAVLAALDPIGTVRPDVRRDPFDSLFEQQVYLRLKARGYHVVPQLPVGGKKRIDLVVIGAKGRLAVECDGDYHHDADPGRIRADQRRERELQRVGWRFWRVRESEFRFDPHAALTGLWQELDRLAIQPADYSGPPVPPPAPGTEWSPLDLPEPDESDPEKYDGDEKGAA